MVAATAVYNHWTGLVDWAGGLDWWTDTKNHFYETYLPVGQRRLDTLTDLHGTPCHVHVSRGMVSKHCKINVETALEVRFCTLPCRAH